jgi:hypothetical protein
MHLQQKKYVIMEKQSKLRFLILAGIFALLLFSLSSCIYGGYGYRDRYYLRPSYGYRIYQRPQVRVYVAPPRRYSYNNQTNRNRNYGYQNRRYRGRESHGGDKSHGRR